MKTQKITTYIGFRRTVMDLRIKINTGFHFLPFLFTGKLSPRSVSQVFKKAALLPFENGKEQICEDGSRHQDQFVCAGLSQKGFFRGV